MLTKHQPTKKTRRKKFLRRGVAAGISLLILMSSMIFATSAAELTFPANSAPTRVYLEGQEVLADECIIIDSITYVPLRKFCNLFDTCKITWNQSTATATVKTDALTMTVRQNAVYITANGHYYYTVGKVLNLSGNLYVPIRPLAKAFAVELDWNTALRCVELTIPDSGVRAVKAASYNADDVYWLSRIIYAEAGAEPFTGQMAVGNVVLNRLRHSSYPNTIYGVIFDRKHGTQFSPVAMGTIYKTPSTSAVIAAKICLEGYSISNSALFFVNPRIATNNWIQRNRPYAFTIGNHDFYN